MNKFLLFTLGMFFSSHNFASEILEYYDCDNDLDALSCNKSCQKKGSIRFLLKDNSATNLLMQSNNFNGVIKSTLLDNCRIADARNWYCSELYSDIRKLSADGYKIFQMIDGKYSEQYNYYSHKLGSNITDTRNAWVQKFGCAK